MPKYMLAFLVKWFIYLFCGCLCTRPLLEAGKKDRKARGMIGSEGKRGTVASRPPAFSHPSHHHSPGSCCGKELEQIFPPENDVSVCFFLIEIHYFAVVIFWLYRVCPQVNFLHTVACLFWRTTFSFTVSSTSPKMGVIPLIYKALLTHAPVGSG